MRVSVAVIALLLSGCVTELLATPSLDARGLACQAFDGETKVRIIHHGDGPPIDDMSADWIVDVSRVLGEDGSRFSWSTGSSPKEPLDAWVADLGVMGKTLRLHVVWLPDLDGDTVAVLAPGVVGINTTAADPVSARGLLFHGLGHALGVVNMGVPLHDADGPSREAPAGHMPGTAMSNAWHRVEDFPRNVTGYADATIMDWQAAVADPAVCP